MVWKPFKQAFDPNVSNARWSVRDNRGRFAKGSGKTVGKEVVQSVDQSSVSSKRVSVRDHLKQAVIASEGTDDYDLNVAALADHYEEEGDENRARWVRSLTKKPVPVHQVVYQWNSPPLQRRKFTVLERLEDKTRGGDSKSAIGLRSHIITKHEDGVHTFITVASDRVLQSPRAQASGLMFSELEAHALRISRFSIDPARPEAGKSLIAGARRVADSRSEGIIIDDTETPIPDVWWELQGFKRSAHYGNKWIRLSV